jgi:hypothetical protein
MGRGFGERFLLEGVMMVCEVSFLMHILGWEVELRWGWRWGFWFFFFFVGKKTEGFFNKLGD